MAASAVTQPGTAADALGNLPATSWRTHGRFRGPAASDQGVGRLWEIRLIEAGVSKNGKRYAASVLREAVKDRVFNGISVRDYEFTDGKRKHLPLDVLNALPEGVTRNRIGQITEVWFNEADQAIDAIVAVDDEQTRTRWLNAHARGALGTGSVEGDVEGFSIDTVGREAEGQDGITDVLKIHRANSLDNVTNPAAGGRIKRLVADTDTPDDPPTQPPNEGPRQEETMSDEALAKLEQKFDAQQAELATLREEVKATRILAAMDDDVARLMQWSQALVEAEGDAREQLLKSMGELIASLLGEEPEAVAVQTEAAKQRLHALEAMLGEDRIKEDADLSDRLKSVIAAFREEAEPPSPEAQRISAMENRLREQALDHHAQREGADLGFHDYREALSLADLDGVDVAADGLTVTGLREAFEACKKARPHLCAQQETAPTAGDAKAGDPPAAATSTPAPAAKPAPRGQDVPQRETEDDGEKISGADYLARALRHKDFGALQQFDRIRRSGALGRTA